MNKHKVLCIFCARASSKRLKNKNFNHLFIKYLIYYTKKQTISSKMFDKIVFSTVSARLKKWLKSLEPKLSLLDQRNILKIKL